MTTHSDKALKTLALMNTSATDWKKADVKWKKETRLVRGKVTCPDCHGGKVVLREQGQVIPAPKPYTDEHREYLNKARDQYKANHDRALDTYRGNCDRCRCDNTRARAYGYCSGQVDGEVETQIWVGYIQWPEGVCFESRFSGGNYCGLCNKNIYASNLVPVVGHSGDKNLGMWVGQDCAKKFLPGVHTYEAPEKGEDFIFNQ